MKLNTAWLLMARYEGLPVIPIDVVGRDFFPHLTTDHLLHKISSGEIGLPLVRIERSAKSAKGISLFDLAQYIDRRIEAARKEHDQLSRPNAVANKETA